MDAYCPRCKEAVPNIDKALVRQGRCPSCGGQISIGSVGNGANVAGAVAMTFAVGSRIALPLEAAFEHTELEIDPQARRDAAVPDDGELTFPGGPVPYAGDGPTHSGGGPQSATPPPPPPDALSEGAGPPADGSASSMKGLSVMDKKMPPPPPEDALSPDGSSPEGSEDAEATWGDSWSTPPPQFDDEKTAVVQTPDLRRDESPVGPQQEDADSALAGAASEDYDTHVGAPPPAPVDDADSGSLGATDGDVAWPENDTHVGPPPSATMNMHDGMPPPAPAEEPASPPATSEDAPSMPPATPMDDDTQVGVPPWASDAGAESEPAAGHAESAAEPFGAEPSPPDTDQEGAFSNDAESSADSLGQGGELTGASGAADWGDQREPGMDEPPEEPLSQTTDDAGEAGGAGEGEDTAVGPVPSFTDQPDGPTAPALDEAQDQAAAQKAADEAEGGAAVGAEDGAAHLRLPDIDFSMPAGQTSSQPERRDTLADGGELPAHLQLPSFPEFELPAIPGQEHDTEVDEGINIEGVGRNTGSFGALDEGESEQAAADLGLGEKDQSDQEPEGAQAQADESWTVGTPDKPIIPPPLPAPPPLPPKKNKEPEKEALPDLPAFALPEFQPAPQTRDPTLIGADADQLLAAANRRGMGTTLLFVLGLLALVVVGGAGWIAYQGFDKTLDMVAEWLPLGEPVDASKARAEERAEKAVASFLEGVEAYKAALKADGESDKDGARKSYRKAIVHFRRAIKLQPQMGDAHRSLGIALAKTNHQAEAVRHYRTYLRLTPDAKDAEEVKKIISDWEKANKGGRRR